MHTPSLVRKFDGYTMYTHVHFVPTCTCSHLYFILQVELSFLMVGHTHEDVEKLFGNLGKWLGRSDAYTVPGNIHVHVHTLSL